MENYLKEYEHLLKTEDINVLSNIQQRQVFELRNKLKKPLAKINKKPLTIGSVIYLKFQSDISSTYNDTLKNLVDGRHRFVVIDGISNNDIKKVLPPYYNRNDPAIPICLLSTSKYMNQELQLGIKLKGDYSKYGNGKSVYMDTKNIYMIKPSCISEISYHFDLVDIGYLTIDSLSKLTELKVHGGLANDIIINNTMIKYNMVNEIADGRYRKELRCNNRELLINGMLLSSKYDMESLRCVIHKILGDNFEIAKSRFKKPDMTDDDFYRYLFVHLMKVFSDDEIDAIYQSAQRNYIVKEVYS